MGVAMWAGSAVKRGVACAKVGVAYAEGAWPAEVQAGLAEGWGAWR